MPHPVIPFLHAPCKRCGRPMERRRYNERLEDRSTFKRRVYCDRACMAAAQEKETVSQSALLWRARRHRKSCCEACGETRRLHVHHCDGNQANNDPSNLQTLCQFCHDFWHALLKRRKLPITGRVPVLAPNLGSAVSPE